LKVLVFYGDAFLAREALESFRSEWLAPAEGGFGGDVVRVDGSEARPDDLLSLCQSTPMFGGRRLVIVQGLLGRFDPEQQPGEPRRRRRRAPKRVPEGWESFVEQARHGPEGTVVAFLEGKLSKDNPLLTLLKPVAELRECRPLGKNELPAWIRERAERYGLRLQGSAIALLTELVGNELAVLDSELQKLATYGGGATVTEDDVALLVREVRRLRLYELTDPVFEGRAQAAQAALQRLLREGEVPQYILQDLARHARQLIQVRALLERRVPKGDLQGRLGGQVPTFVVDKLVRQAPRLSLGQVRWAYHRLLEADLQTKRGIFDDQTALSLLVAELAALGRRPRQARAQSSAW
jgi:DNA polymerase III delta subunit